MPSACAVAFQVRAAGTAATNGGQFLAARPVQTCGSAIADNRWLILVNG
jgi:hypothetical protein